jgi:chemotaxis protein CheX
MLTVLLMKMNESDVTHENLCDLVGEVANTISGNVRRDFGRDFAISAPTVLSGTGAPIAVPRGCRPVVIPLHWRGHAARLVVCLQ